MTLAELRAQLDALNLPDDTPVVLATDEQRAVAKDDEWDQAPPSAAPAVFLWPAS